MVGDSGSIVNDMKCNVDVDLQITQTEGTVSGQESYNVLMDYKGIRPGISVFLFSVILV